MGSKTSRRIEKGEGMKIELEVEDLRDAVRLFLKKSGRLKRGEDISEPIFSVENDKPAIATAYVYICRKE